MNHLQKYLCNPELYLKVKLAKDSTLGFTEAIRVETSTKDGKQNRYIIPILLSEFRRFSIQDKKSIIKFLGFTMDKYYRFIDDPNIGPNTDLILGVDGKKGKLYLDYGHQNIKLKCLESNGKIKYYLKKDSDLDSDILQVKINGKISGHHYRLETPRINNKGDYIYWVAEAVDGTKTYYTRPRLPLIDLVDFINYVKN